MEIEWFILIFFIRKSRSLFLNWITPKKTGKLGLVGENGSGKSTLLKIISGVLQSDKGGSVKVFGKIALFLEMVVGFQPELTAEENVRLYGAVMGMSEKEMEERFDRIFEFAEMSRFRQMKLKNFSSGMYIRPSTEMAGVPLTRGASSISESKREYLQPTLNNSVLDYNRCG